jgi:hypothetical protein
MVGAAAVDAQSAAVGSAQVQQHKHIPYSLRNTPDEASGLVGPREAASGTRQHFREAICAIQR